MENLTRLDNPNHPAVRILSPRVNSARIILTAGGEKLYISISFDCSNWETLIKLSYPPETQSKKLFGVQAKDHSALWLTQDGDIVLDSTRVYGNMYSDLYIALVGCKLNVAKGQSGKGIVSSSSPFPYPQDLSWICDNRSFGA